MAVFTSKEFIDRLIQLVNEIPNYYYSQNGTWCTYNPSNGKFMMDCVVSVKGILWGWNGNVNATYGGAVYCEGKCSISNSNFHGNFFYKVDTSGESYGTYGGAVYSEGDLTISNSHFEEHRMQTKRYGKGGGTVYAAGQIFHSFTLRLL